jgi:ABC-type transport system involved in multi-copper enzyme maturation permease subunit
MAIFQKAYQGYSGPLSTSLDRTLVIYRYAMADVFKSRAFVAYFFACLLLPLFLVCALYGYHNLELLLQMEVVLGELSEIDGDLVAVTVQLPQNFLLFFLVLAIGPAMISPDLRNNAMPLILSRSITKTNYIVGKMLVLIVLGSLISWVPALLLFFVQSFLAGDGWMVANWHIPFAAIITSLTWIISLTLLAFAISAFVKWKAIARIFFFGVLVLSSIMGEVIIEIFGGTAGNYINLSAALQVLTASTYDAKSGLLSLVSDINVPDIPVQVAITQFAVFCSVTLILLIRRIRAFQVV